PGAAKDGDLRRLRRRWLPRIRAAARAGAAQPGVEGLLGRGPIRRWAAPRGSDRPVRGARLPYMASKEAARLMEDAGDPIVAGWARARAARLAGRFRRDFWMRDTGFPAMALDGRKRRVDAVGSNAAHVLWTGILSQWQVRAVARHLLSDVLFSGWGVRTLATSNRGYNPVSYHAGSVWPHDT